MLLLLLVMALLAATHAQSPNILYLMADDLRPQLGCYGHTYMQTPNLDFLAANALQFDFACAYAHASTRGRGGTHSYTHARTRSLTCSL